MGERRDVGKTDVLKNFHKLLTAPWVHNATGREAFLQKK